MKRLSTLFFGLLMLALVNVKALSQTPNHTIDVDFNHLQKEYTKTVNNKQTFVVHIRNLNRTLFKVDGIKTETDFNVAVPAALTGIKLPAYLFTSLPAKSEIASLPLVCSKRRSTDILDEIKRELDAINAKAKKLDDAIFLYNDLTHLSKNC